MATNILPNTAVSSPTLSTRQHALRALLENVLLVLAPQLAETAERVYSATQLTTLMCAAIGEPGDPEETRILEHALMLLETTEGEQQREFFGSLAWKLEGKEFRVCYAPNVTVH